VGRAGQEDYVLQDETALIELARQELRLTLGISAQPLISKVFVWERSMPQYNLGHSEKLSLITQRLEKSPGLALAGSAYRGIGIPDCIHSAILAVEALLPQLTPTIAQPA
jgi:oxygen-dependent protoporphyrinogen oxidase